MAKHACYQFHRATYLGRVGGGAIHAVHCGSGSHRTTDESEKCGNMAIVHCCQSSADDGGDEREETRPHQQCWSEVKRRKMWEADSTRDRRPQ